MKTEIVKVNDIQIECPYNPETNEHFVVIKPICEALEIDFSVQVQSIKNDPILSSVVVLNTTTGKDGKRYEMLTLPLRYFYGWLFGIHPNKVKPEAREAVIQYKRLIYDAIYNYFHSNLNHRSELLKQKTWAQLEIERIEKSLAGNNDYQRLKELKTQVKQTGNELKNLDNDIIVKQLDMFEKANDE